MSRQLALGGQPVLVAHWSEALAVVEERHHLNRLFLVDAPMGDARLGPLVQAAAARGCALVICLGAGAERVQRRVDALCDATAPAGQVVASSWHDPSIDPAAAEDAFSLFSDWVGGGPGVPLLVTEDAGLETILDAARTLHARSLQRGPERGA
jgi:hypothetical protein